ncbi:MAG: CHASE2 domain-containing protein [Planctomycetes bacterium]|nr:CHASE2 domain-containing protein [Planctomycetota bacterium]
MRATLSRWFRNRAALAAGLIGAGVALLTALTANFLPAGTPVIGVARRGFDFLERGIADTLLAARDKTGDADRRIVIVEIDDRSLEAFGEFPVPRRYYADFFAAATLARAVAVDVLFTDASHRFSEERLDEERRKPGAPTDPVALYRTLKDVEDRDLTASVARAGNVVIPLALPDPVVSRRELLKNRDAARLAIQALERETGAALAEDPEAAEGRLRDLARRHDLPLTAFKHAVEQQRHDRAVRARAAVARWAEGLSPGDRAAFDAWRRSAGGTDAGRADLPGAAAAEPADLLLWLGESGRESQPWDSLALFLRGEAGAGVGGGERLRSADVERAVVRETAGLFWSALRQEMTRAGATFDAAFAAWLAAESSPRFAGVTRIEDQAVAPLDRAFRERLFAERFPPEADTPPDAGVPVSPLAQGLPLIGLFEGAAQIASIAAMLDDDGKLRRYPPLLRHLAPDESEQYVPSLMLAALLAARRLPPAALRVTPGVSIAVPAAAGDPEVTIPLAADGAMAINWLGRWDEVFEHRSFQKVLADFRASPESRERVRESFRGKYVFLGLTAVGSHDIKPNPLQRDFPMVGAHAQALSNALSADYLRPAGWWSAAAVGAAMAVAFLAGLALHRLRTVVWVGGLIGAAALWVLFALWQAAGSREVPVAGAVLPLAAAMGAEVLFNYLSVDRRRNLVQKMFSTYLAPQVIDRLLREGAALPGGEKRDLTILFSDIAGFTTWSERLDPAALVAFLNEYLSEMEAVISACHGVVDKYIGDAVMAFFGAPENLPDHGRRAVQAAVAMQEKLRELNARWQAAGQSVRLGVRVGVNTGEVLVGNVGSRRKMNYTVIGDAVNLASRLESANKFWGFQIMISEASRAFLRDDFETVPLGRIAVKGKHEGVSIFAVTGRAGAMSPEDARWRERFSEALARFQERDFPRAVAGFRALPGDSFLGLAASRYIDECERYLVSPPPADWAGEFVMETK